jgi:hypothetical protein
MHKFFTSSFDASIYLQQPEQNAGRDEILEVGKLYYGSTKDIARALIKFDIEQISSSIVENNITSSYKVYLNLKSANSEEVPLEYTIYANAISQSWTMGTGTKFDNITTDGVSWKYRNGVDSWQDNTIGGTANYVGSGATGSANAEGGTWYTGSEASQSYNYEPDDVRMDVTNIIHQWVSGSLPNNGLIIHHGLDSENDTLDYGVLKFFSKETNTIYEPKLELVWNDQSFITGSLTSVTGSISDDDYKVVFQNLKNEYPQDQKIKIRVKGRDMFPLKTFGTTFAYDQTKYLPITTYYQLEDYKTDEIIFPFGDYTKVSCDSISNYFLIDLSTLPINRTYVLKLKIVESGISTIIDDKLIFEII